LILAWNRKQILHPAYPGSVYHTTKCLDALLFQVQRERTNEGGWVGFGEEGRRKYRESIVGEERMRVYTAKCLDALLSHVQREIKRERERQSGEEEWDFGREKGKKGERDEGALPRHLVLWRPAVPGSERAEAGGRGRGEGRGEVSEGKTEGERGRDWSREGQTDAET
jgi:hypothetical protein